MSLTILTFLAATLLVFVPVTEVFGAKDRILEFTPQVPIPGMSSGPTPVGSESGGRTSSDLLARYIQAIYNYGLSLGGILAAVVLMGGGVLWLTSGGSENRVSQAKNIIAGSVTGLILLFGSWMLLNTINPELLQLRSISMIGVGTIESASQIEYRFGCCECEINIATQGTRKTCSSNVGMTPEECKTLCLGKVDQIRGTNTAIVISDYRPAHKWDHKCGVEEGQTNSCTPYISNLSSLYSSTFTSTGWAFQPGIENQIGDMSPQLAQLLNCMRDNLPKGIGEISSISDSNYIGDLSHCSKTICYPPPFGKEKCVHACGSCHYGSGGSYQVNKSYAVDFGDEQNHSLYEEAANKCDYNAYVLREKTHTHVSSSACRRY